MAPKIEKVDIVRYPARWKVPEVAEWLGMHPTSVYKILKERHGSCPVKVAMKMERLTGINRVHWVWPKEYGNPWGYILEHGELPDTWKDVEEVEEYEYEDEFIEEVANEDTAGVEADS